MFGCGESGGEDSKRCVDVGDCDRRVGDVCRRDGEGDGDGLDEGDSDEDTTISSNSGDFSTRGRFRTGDDGEVGGGGESISIPSIPLSE